MYTRTRTCHWHSHRPGMVAYTRIKNVHGVLVVQSFQVQLHSLTELVRTMSGALMIYTGLKSSTQPEVAVVGGVPKTKTGEEANDSGQGSS